MINKQKQLDLEPFETEREAKERIERQRIEILRLNAFNTKRYVSFFNFKVFLNPEVQENAVVSKL